MTGKDWETSLLISHNCWVSRESGLLLPTSVPPFSKGNYETDLDKGKMNLFTVGQNWRERTSFLSSVSMVRIYQNP
ncbi:rCG57204 [Rattus norvegicus]|uniref:RCG57204 n=1 Tax=Rattus norvegicus TaxID=10116 RepID=A6KPI1_RAT|nr:rCG57204 [Rattus norvegicus]